MAVASYSAEIRKNIANLDSLESTCGNQFGADTASPRYSFLAGVFADDRIYVDTSTGTCSQYLGAELGVLGLLTPGTECGGRKLAYDVMETSYSALAVGVLTGVDDTIGADEVDVKPLGTFLPATLALSKYGEIEIDAKGHTSVPGIFAAGDATTTPFKQIVIAMGDGAKAALGAFEHLIRRGAGEPEEAHSVAKAA